MKRVISLIALTCAFAAFTQSAAAATFYAPEYNDDRVATFNVDAGGAPTPLTGTPFGLPSGGLTAFATTPDGNKAAAGYLFNPGLRGVTVGADGSISAAQPKIDFAENGVHNVAVSPDSRFAYFATRDDSGPVAAGVRAYSFSENGVLTELVGSPYSTDWEFLDVAVTPDQRFLYGTVGMGLIVFSINSDGTLTTIGNTGGVVAEWVSTSPDGRFVFVGGESGGNAALRSFAIEPSGNLTELGAPIISTDTSGKAPAVAPNGRFVYLPENNDDLIYVARVNPDGTLTQVGTLPGVEARSIVVSPDSARLFIHEGGGSGQLMVSQIGPDGVPGAPAGFAPYSPSTPTRMHFRAGLGGAASFTAKPATKPLTVTFDGSKSSVKRGVLGALEWTIDGTGVTGAVQTRKFAKPGVYDVSLTVRDSDGCGSQRVWLGQTATCSGSPESTKTIKYDTPPWVTSMSISPKRIGKRTKVKFKLTEKSRVTFTVQRPTRGRLVGTSCRKQTSKNRKAKRCTRWVNVKSFRVNGRAGRTNAVKFTGKIGKTKLKKGRYRLRAIAVDSAKGKSPQRTVSFRIR